MCFKTIKTSDQGGFYPGGILSVSRKELPIIISTYTKMTRGDSIGGGGGGGGGLGGILSVLIIKFFFNNITLKFLFSW